MASNKKYPGETTAPKMGPRLSSVLPSGRSCKEARSIHKLGGQPKRERREEHKLGGGIASSIVRKIVSPGKGIGKAARVAAEAPRPKPAENTQVLKKGGSSRQHKMMGGLLGKSLTINAGREKHRRGGMSGLNFSRVISNFTKKSGLGAAAKQVAKVGQKFIMPAMAQMPGVGGILGKLGTRAMQDIDFDAKQGGRAKKRQKHAAGAVAKIRHDQYN